MKPEEQVRADFEAWWVSAPHRTKYSTDHPAYLAGEEAYRAAYAQARREALEEALEIVCEAKENICAGGLAENRQYEESIVGPHLDGVADEIDALIKGLQL